MIRVLHIEPIGGHRGMHYYDFSLCNALAAQGVQPILLTSDETDTRRYSLSFPVDKAFRGIYGRGRSLQRGLNYLRALLHIAKRSPHNDGEIAHLHYFLVPLFDYLFLRVMKRKGFKIIITAHDIVPFNQKPSSLLSAIYHLAERVIVHAQVNQQEIMSTFHLPAGRIAVIPQGHYLPYANARLSEAEAKAKLGIPAGHKMVLFFGQIKRVKGLDYLIQAFPAVLRAHPQTILSITGPVWKDDWSRYDSMIQSLGLQDHVLTRIRHIPDQDVATYFCAADVVVLPYLKIYQSAVLQMAYSYGRPVVATATGGMVEVLRDGETGYLVPPRDSEALARAICQMLADKAHAEEMGRKGRHLVETKYSWTGIAAEMKRVYEEALAAKGVVSP